MSQATRPNDRHIIWSDMHLDVDDWREGYKEFLEINELDADPNDEQALYEWMEETNYDYLSDERVNLNVQLSQPIIVIGDIGRWNGRVMGYKDIPSGNIQDAKQFYEETYHFIEEKFGADNIISAVMHADEINVAATEELGKEVYHYHLHAMVLPVVEKEILWSKRCKDEKLRGTVKEVVNQISHSKKWKSDIPLTDEKGNPLLRKNGKPMFRASYSILQDELFNHMTEQGFKGFQRGEYGSTAEHLTSLQYQIKQDKERLEKLQKRIQREQIKYEPARNVSKTYNEIDRMGQKTITGKMAISKEDYSQLTALAKEGITSRAEISELEQSANYYRQKYFDCANALERMKTKYNELKEKCRPFLQALEHFPEVSKLFTEKVKQLFSFKEAQERAEKEAREKERQERIKARRNKRDMER